MENTPRWNVPDPWRIGNRKTSLMLCDTTVRILSEHPCLSDLEPPKMQDEKTRQPLRGKTPRPLAKEVNMFVNRSLQAPLGGTPQILREINAEGVTKSNRSIQSRKIKAAAPTDDDEGDLSLMCKMGSNRNGTAWKWGTDKYTSNFTAPELLPW